MYVCVWCVCMCVIFLRIIITSILSVTEDTSSSKTDQLFTRVKEAIKEIRFDWYSLAVELDIDYATRKVRLP